MIYIKSLYQLLIRFGRYLTPAVLLIFRLAWGWELFESGRAHLGNVSAMVERFQSWGVPLPHLNVYISGYTEMLGGLLLMVGLASRLISIPLFFNFCVAYLTASHDTIVNFFHQDPSNFIDDAAFPFLITSILILAVGPGLISIDGFLKYVICRRSNAVAPKVDHSDLSSSDSTRGTAIHGSVGTRI
jgi:putative oxidoreductase